MSLTEYQIAVFAVYSNAASEGLRGTETTRKYTCHVHYGCQSFVKQDLRKYTLLHCHLDPWEGDGATNP